MALAAKADMSEQPITQQGPASDSSLAVLNMKQELEAKLAALNAATAAHRVGPEGLDALVAWKIKEAMWLSERQALQAQVLAGGEGTDGDAVLREDLEKLTSVQAERQQWEARARQWEATAGEYRAQLEGTMGQAVQERVAAEVEVMQRSMGERLIQASH